MHCLFKSVLQWVHSELPMSFGLKTLTLHISVQIKYWLTKKKVSYNRYKGVRVKKGLLLPVNMLNAKYELKTSISPDYLQTTLAAYYKGPLSKQSLTERLPKSDHLKTSCMVNSPHRHRCHVGEGASRSYMRVEQKLSSDLDWTQNWPVFIWKMAP